MEGREGVRGRLRGRVVSQAGGELCGWGWSRNARGCAEKCRLRSREDGDSMRSEWDFFLGVEIRSPAQRSSRGVG